MKSPQLQKKTFLILLITVTLAFGWILLPFYGAVFWGTVLAIIFTPFHRRLLVRMNHRANLAALTTLFLCIIIVLLPTAALVISLIQEVSSIYERLGSQPINAGNYFQTMIKALPEWLVRILDRFGLSDLTSLLDKVGQATAQGGQTVAKQVLSFGQNAFGLVVSLGIMLYLLFFLLRDGPSLSARLRLAIPLSPEHKRHLFSKFTAVVRATVK